MAKKGAFEKVVLQKSKSWSNEENLKSRSNNTNRFLITINILGSSGPIRIVVNEKDVVFSVIETALKSYAREGRLPVLGSDATDFFLYSSQSHAGFDALCPSESIGSYGTRKFLLCKKQGSQPKTEARSKVITQKGSAGWKWLAQSFSFKSFKAWTVL